MKKNILGFLIIINFLLLPFSWIFADSKDGVYDKYIHRYRATILSIVDETTDTTCFPLFTTAAEGPLNPKSGGGLSLNSATGALTSTSFVGALTGNADTATALETARTIGGTSFDGTANIVPATITLADEVTDTTCFPLFAIDATAAQAPKTGGGLSLNSNTSALTATTFIGALTGNASTATALETARTIGGTSFDGTANIVPATITLADETTDTTCFPLFSTAATSAQEPKTGGGLSLNSATGALTATSFVGPLAGNAATVTIADETTDTTCFPLFVVTATGAQEPKSGGGLSLNSATSALTATTFIGALTGQADTVATITGLAPDTATTQATQANITSLGTLTALQVDNINLDLNTISSTAGTDLLITPLAGQQIVLDGAIIIDAGIVTGATSISSTGFTGALTGQADTVATITGLAPDTATTAATQAAITTCSNLVTVGALDAGSITSNFGAIDTGASNIITTGTIGASGAAIADGVTATTQAPTDNSTKVATTAYADAITKNREVTTVNTATYDLLVTDHILHVTYTSTAAVTSLTLPTAQVVSGRIITIKDAAGNAGTYSITIDTEGAADLDGADTLVINSNYGATSLYCDGTNWFIY